MTIVATGVGRSGTTMVSRILGELGVFMGASLTGPTHEDAEVKQCVKTSDEERFARLCRLRDAGHDVWGFKNPGFRDLLPLWEKHLRNPRVIFIFRDILAIAMRNHLALDMDVLEALGLATRSYDKALRRLSESQCPALLLSYEKCLAAPDEAVQRIGEFCGVSLSAAGVAAATAAIRNGDPRYLASDGP